MNDSYQDVGYFVFSLDTELAWGSLWDQRPPKQSSRNGLNERATINRLLNIMDEFGVVATWAITGHLFYEKCEECDICPIRDLKEWDSRYEQIWGTADRMWYGSDIVDTLLSSNAGHEICFHGYTHRVFNKLSKEEAQFEIQEWIRLAKRKNLVPITAIFPQGGIGHLDLFREAGYICYRGKEVRHPALSIPLIGKILNRLNLALSFLNPQVYDINVDPNGLINIPSSQWLFRINRRVETMLDFLNLETLRLHTTLKSIDRAANEKKVIHLWVHPHEFRTEKDFEKLRFIFREFAQQAKQRKLKSITMGELARRSLIKSNPDLVKTFNPEYV